MSAGKKEGLLDVLPCPLQPLPNLENNLASFVFVRKKKACNGEKQNGIHKTSFGVCGPYFRILFLQ